MQVLNTNAKQQYTYTRYWYPEVSDAILHDILYTNAVRKSRHYRIQMHGNKNGKGITYYDITAGFDCETYTDKVTELAYVYVWQICLNGTVIKGRKHTELIELFDRIQTMLKPNHNHRLLVFDHNLNYEFSFFRGWLNLDDANENFLKDIRSPLKLTHNHFIEFRDSMSLVGGDSLKGLAQKYCNTQKCVGDLDYNTPFNELTPFTELEESYMDNDVLILHEFARWVFDDLMSKYTKLPMTQTGILTNECKYLLHEMYPKTDAWHTYNINRSPANADIYKAQSNYLYRGGFTHSCVDIVEDTITDLMGVDITSSYPYVMTQKVFPDHFMYVGEVDENRVNTDIESGLVSIFVADFYGIKSTGLHSIESKHKCLEITQDAIIDNGRVYYAGHIKVYLTSFDWLNYNHFYQWESVKITAYEVSKVRYLYKHIVQPMLKYYKIKAELKREGLPYAIQKSRANSFYGMCVKRQNGEQTKYSNLGFSTDDAKSYADQLKTSIVCFYDGVFISAVARWRLLTLAYDVYTKFGIKSVYCDTDSHKFMHPTPALVEYLESINESIREDNIPNIEYFTDYSQEYSDLGEWDIEYWPMSMYKDDKRSYIRRFKTLGAKRYIIEVDQYNKNKQARERVLNQTVAGLPKGKMLEQYCTIDNCFGKFENNMAITGCKLQSKYIDEPYEITVTDRDGVTHTHTELSGVALLPSNFSLTIDELWQSWYMSVIESRWYTDGREKRLI